jgi:hypothetical protein
MPFSARFEHTHIVAGSGHGKTQLLQQMILKDLNKLAEGQGSVVVIDSQGDLLRNIVTLSERLVLIDPTDIDHPPALNLFDFGLERLTRYSRLEREKLSTARSLSMSICSARFLALSSPRSRASSSVIWQGS